MPANDAFPPRSARDADTDLMRGIAILGVVCIHACGMLLPETLYYDASYYFRWAVPFFVGIFAYYSARPPAPGDYWRVVRERYVRLGIPYLAYSALYWFALGDFRADDTGAALWRYVAGNGWAGQYFFVLLFQLVPLVPLLARHRLHGGWVVASIALALWGLPGLPAAFERWPALASWSDRPFVYWLPYVLLGVYLRQHAGAWRDRLARVPAWLAAPAMFAAPVWLSATRDPEAAGGPYLAAGVVAVSCLVLALYPAAIRRVRLPWLAALGRHSLVVFCLNPLSVPVLRKLAAGLGVLTVQPAAAVGMATLAVATISAGCMAAGALLRRTGLRALAL